MKKIIGFALFFIAVGIIIMMFLPNIFVGILVALLSILFGYLLFCNC